MEALISSLIGIVIVQFSLLWYRIGRVEQKVKDLNNHLRREGNGQGVQGTVD